jgi:CubicO group peptidase (beta-lactamase class C family)
MGLRSLHHRSASADAGSGHKGHGWSGGSGTVWANDPEEDLVAILFTQVLSSTGRSPAEPDFSSTTYRTLDG